MVSEDDIRKLLKGELTETDIERLKVDAMFAAIWSELAMKDYHTREMRKFGYTIFPFSHIVGDDVKEFVGCSIRKSSLGQCLIRRIIEYNNDPNRLFTIEMVECGGARQVSVSKN
jgi:hypothetical protein